MSRGRGTVNKVILVGRLGADAQVKYTPSGKAVANFSVATNTVWKDAEGNQKEKTNWHRIVVWEKLAEFAGEYLKKGGSIYVEGSIETRSYEDANGVKRYVTEVKATDIEMLGRKGEAAETTESQPPAEGPGEAHPAAGEDDLPF